MPYFSEKETHLFNYFYKKLAFFRFLSYLCSMMKRLLLFLLFALVGIVSSVAQESVFRNFSSMQYKGGTQNWCVEQLPNGVVAFGNNVGLLFFDGERWDVFPISNYSTVRALCYDHATGRMYAGASNEFGYYEINKHTYQYVYYSLVDKLKKADRNFGEIWKIQSWGKNLVFQSKSHLFIYNKVSGQLITIHPGVRIETICEGQGKLYVATCNNISILSGNKLVALPGATFSSHIVVRALAMYHGKLIVATQQNGLLSYEGNVLTPYATNLSGMLAANQIFSMAIQGDKLALGTVRQGLVVKDLTSDSTQYVNTSQGLQNNTVLSVAFDKRGSVWMGLDNGISYAMLNAPFSNIVSERYSIGTGYNSLALGNILYLGTNQGLFMSPLTSVQQLSSRTPESVKGIVGQVWRLGKIGNDVLCCTDVGLFQIRGDNAVQIGGLDGTWNFCALKRHPGNVVVTDYQGMAILRRQGSSYVLAHRVKMPVEVSGNFYEDVDGTLWMSNWLHGVYHLAFSADLKSIRLLETFNSKHQLVVDEGNHLCQVGGQIYVSSVDGFYIYDHHNHRLVYDKKMSKLFDTYGMALHLEETPSHDIWGQKLGFLAIAHRTAKGYQVDSMSYRPIVKNQNLGLANMSVIDGNLSVINSSNGFYLVRNRYVNHAKDFALSIRRIISTNDGDSTVYRELYGKPAEGETPHIELTHALNSIRIEYVMPEYQTEDAVTYQCYLENYDSRWSNQGSVTSKEYTRLGKGTYIFHVKAYNRLSGKTQETQIKITILPAWYETIWANIFYFLLIVAAFVGIMRYLKWRADRELNHVKLENERKMAIERAERKAEVAEMRNEQLQTDLKHKSGELATSTMNLIHQNDILQKLDENMAALSESVRREDKKTVVTHQIADIRNALQEYLNDDDGWNKFEENFNLVYDDFMKKLTAQYTNLKMSDRKLCAYLRMGLSSKEMASLLNMSVRSIETARYRLRKKLNLEAGDNLTDFIQNFGKE